MQGKEAEDWPESSKGNKPTDFVYPIWLDTQI